jgi:hypothetical protein
MWHILAGYQGSSVDIGLTREINPSNIVSSNYISQQGSSLNTHNI